MATIDGARAFTDGVGRDDLHVLAARRGPSSRPCARRCARRAPTPPWPARGRRGTDRRRRRRVTRMAAGTSSGVTRGHLPAREPGHRHARRLARVVLAQQFLLLARLRHQQAVARLEAAADTAAAAAAPRHRARRGARPRTRAWPRAARARAPRPGRAGPGPAAAARSNGPTSPGRRGRPRATIGFKPAVAHASAVAVPVRPPPTMTTSASCSPRSRGKEGSARWAAIHGDWPYRVGMILSILQYLRPRSATSARGHRWPLLRCIVNMRRALRIAAGAGALLVLGLAGGGWWAYGRLSASLPALDGQLTLSGLAAPVTVERDGLGIPTIRGRSRAGRRARHRLPARAGPLLPDGSGAPARRRRAGGARRPAGASRSIGGRACTACGRRRARPWRCCRTTTRACWRRMSRGVNAGLQALAAPPFEYPLLRQAPAALAPRGQHARRAVDVPHAAGRGRRLRVHAGDDARRAAAGDVRPDGAGRHRVGRARRRDCRSRRRRCRGRRSTTCGGRERASRRSSCPARSDVAAARGPDAVERRGRRRRARQQQLGRGRPADARRRRRWSPTTCTWRSACRTPGIARASSGPTRPTGETHTLVGTTLPGVPSLVTGSNTHVAWGFTNTYADWTRPGPARAGPSRPEPLPDARGLAALRRSTRKRSPWPVRTPRAPDRALDDLGTGARHRLHGPPARVRAGWGTRRTGSAASLHAARDASARWKRPSTRPTAPACRGRTWSSPSDRAASAGPSSAPSRTASASTDGCPRRGPTAGAAGTDGSTPCDYPRMIDPPGDRIWTANARVVDGAMLARLGDGSYEVGARATMIRDRLRERESFTAARHAGHPARRARDVPGAVARSDPGPSDEGRRGRRPGAAAVPRRRGEELDRSGVAGLGGLPADAHVPRPGDGPGDLVRARRMLRSRRHVRLHHGAPARGRRSGSWRASGPRTC